MEIEFKFQIPQARLPALEADMLAGGARYTPLRARYFDTPGGALGQHGVVLRLRQEGAGWVQTAKAMVPAKGLLHRLEHNFALQPEHSGASMAPDVQRHAGTRVGKRIAKILKQDGASLVETFATDISRLSCIQQLGQTKLELALDVGKVMSKAGDQAAGQYRESLVCELELELVEGELADLVSLAARWSQRHGLWLSTLSKAERGERLMSGVAATAVKAQPPDFSDVKEEGLSAALVQRRVLSACLAQVLPNAGEVASGNEDPETVHQLRIGLRRLRTALRALEDLARPAKAAGGMDQGSDFESLNAPALTQAFRVLGAHREQHLMLDELLPKLRHAGAPAMAWPQPSAALPCVAEVLRAEAFQTALVGLVGFASSEVPPSGEADVRQASPIATLRKRLDKLFRQIVRDGQGFEGLAADAQHRVRKRLKRLRYLSEFVGPLFGDKAAKRFVEQLAPAQEALGALNDDTVAVEALRKVAATDPNAWFAVGWLTAGQAGKIAACNLALTRLAEVSPFWRKT
ncbi:CHAD domain-containing protein [Variovorax sp. HJSM1_2]|uniref:CYTH and CHAD domain-containing protein n=1 Tax=Variovorax sp. HJSM1_2 TaxID=3366263 RepID=UPI003BD47A06